MFRSPNCQRSLASGAVFKTVQEWIAAFLRLVAAGRDVVPDKAMLPVAETVFLGAGLRARKRKKRPSARGIAARTG